MGPLDLTVEDIVMQPAQPAFDQERWTEQQSEERGAGGRQLLGIALSLAAALWLAYAAWSAGRTLVGQPLSSPAVAQWVAIAAGPLALLGLAWLMFGRTRRREAEQFTRSVVAMRSEARSLEALLEVLAQRIGDSRTGARHDGRASDESRRRGHGPARRGHPRVRFEQRTARPPRPGAGPGCRGRADRHRGASRRPSARRSNCASDRRTAALGWQRVGEQNCASGRANRGPR